MSDGAEASHPTRRLDDAVHQRTRLGILTVLCEGERADFGFLRRTLELTDGNLSRNLTRLAEAGLVVSERVLEGRMPRTWVRITPAGRAALAEELAAMQELIDRVRRSPRLGHTWAPDPLV